MRRRAEEKFEAWPAWLALALIVVLAAAYYLDLFNLQLALAAQVVVLLGAMEIQLLRVTRTGRQLSATLQPRAAVSVVPSWYFALPVVSIGLAIWVGTMHGDAVAIALVIVANISALAAGRFAAQTPAIVGAADPTTDKIVDRKVRGARIRQLLVFATYCPLFLAVIVKPSNVDPIVRIIMMISFCGSMLQSQKLVRFTQSDMMEILDAPLNQNGARA